ncbi:excinuclease ABC subunit UvrB [Metamycoplasma hyosynoviae]|uniref:excinuclease ABC subunit UvrB n=1 Tax=Metamycoplasma hyosynoviae TaxID=29559 RepID=UPI0023597F7E|nr:excinuclease ABC subunit UvrB [Metamycoplasma hyosynoviae]MDC8917309.1 excinuclease ABC subunit UvrB [Metamycoplasma hyosynoviae]
MKIEQRKFILHSSFKPSGDQPEAIDELVSGLEENKEHQVLLGVTGSGKTFTLANVISRVNRPALIISHNKTLASQLYSELKELFPENRVEYFVSYFDYYKPEAYIPKSDLFIEKTSRNNKVLEAMRMSAINALSIRSDTIVVSSVAAIYGEYNPTEYRNNFMPIEIGQKILRKNFLSELIKIGYSRNKMNIDRGEFDVKGDVYEIAPGYTNDYNLRVETFDDEIEAISQINPITKEKIKNFNSITIFPATTYTVNPNMMENVISQIENDLKERIEFFEKNNKLLEAQRIKDRVLNDIDSIKEFGYVNGIENYARYLDGRKPGERPYTLFDYLPSNAIIFIDESHLMIPQLNGMHNGDRSRKTTLVEYGFRLPSALDNRPLKFEEFENFTFPKIYLSATPGDYEINKTNGEITTQYIRPTGLLDPIIEIRPKSNQIQDIYDNIKSQIAKNERTLILTTTKKYAEELALYLKEQKIKCAYIHDQFKTFERNEIIKSLRMGKYDVVIGINLLREGLDIPEVSLICVLNADTNGFMRDKRSLIQIVGRASRNDHGKVLFYADTLTDSMRECIEDNINKRTIQNEYNIKNNIVPKTIQKPIPQSIQSSFVIDDIAEYFDKQKNTVNLKNNKVYVQKLIEQMNKYSNENKFEEAILVRDHLLEIGVDIEELKK